MPDSIDTASSWTEDIDHILNDIRHNSVLLSKAYKDRYFYLRHILQYFKLPTIIISTFNASLSVGLQPYAEQSTISVITCLLALICSVVGSVELYLGIQKGMEDSLSFSKDYYHLAVSVYKVLTLSHDNRPSDSRIVLEDFWNVYTKLAETSHLLDRRILDKLTVIDDINTVGILSRTKSLLDLPPTPKASEKVLNQVS